MSTRRWHTYDIPSASAYMMTDGVPPHASGAVDGALVNASIANYAEARRNVIATVYNVGSSFVWNSEDDIQVEQPWFRVPVGYRICRTGEPKKLKVWIRYSTGVEAPANNVRVRVQLSSGESATEEFSSVGSTWVSLELDLHSEDPRAGESHQPYTWMSIYVNCLAGNTMNVECVCAYQEQTGATPAHVDIDAANNVLGTDDYPDGAFALKLLRDNTEAMREQRLVKANVFTHSFVGIYKVGLYGANNDLFGRYKFVKRAGVSQIKVRVLAAKNIGGADWTWRSEVVGHGNNTTNVTTTNLQWYEHTYNFAGADITDELELELLLDGNEASALTDQYLPGVFVWEVPAGAIAHTVPDRNNVVPGGVIASSQHDNIRDTDDHLWNRGACQILLSDWRVSVAMDNDLSCNATAPSKGDFGQGGTSQVVRTIVFPSTSSKRLRVMMGFTTTTGSTHVKYITIQISDNVAVFTTWDDVWERYGDYTNGAMQFTEPKLTERIVTCELDIPSDEWESVTGANPANLEVYVNAWTANNAEYIMPNWVTVEEIVLAENEFP